MSPKKNLTKIIFIMTIIYSIFVGVIGGFLWGKALGISILMSLSAGGVIGIVIGILVFLFGRAAMAGGNVKQEEATFVNTSIITLFAIFIIGAGILAWIIRLIFF